MSATRLLVLGVVRVSGRTHGYRLGRELMSWGTEGWANVKWGSIYHALRKLTKEGKLRSFVGDGDDAVDRTSYELTDDGEEEFLRLLRDSLRRVDVGHDVQGAGVVFLSALPRDEAIALLEERSGALRTAREALVTQQEGLDAEPVPLHLFELYEMWVTSMAARIGWTDALVERLRAGQYTMADDGVPFGAPEWSADQSAAG